MYDNTKKLVVTGGFGYGVANNIGTLFEVGKTTVDSRPILASGTLTRIRAMYYRNNATPISLCKYRILRKVGNDYNVVGTVTATAHIVAQNIGAGNRFMHDTGVAYGSVAALTMVDDTTHAPIQVLSGDLIAITTDNSGTLFTVTAATAYSVATWNGDTVAGAPTSVASKSLMVSAFIDTTDAILYTKDSSSAVNASIDVPAFYDHPYYIHFVDVAVPDNEILTIQTNIVLYSNQSGLTDVRIMVDMSAKTIFLADRNGTAIKGLRNAVMASSYVTGDKWDIHLYIDPTQANSACVKANVVNYCKGRGPTCAVEDFKHVSLTAGALVAQYGNGENHADGSYGNFPNLIRNITLTASGGSNSTVGNIVVSRDPIVVIGDSFTSSYITGKTVLANAGALLGSAFTIPRYVINGGRAGNRLTTSDDTPTSGATSIMSRCFGFDNSLLDYPHSVYAIVNGPGVNDLANTNTKPTTQTQALIFGHSLPAMVSTIANRVLINNCDVVLCELSYIMPPLAEPEILSPYYQAIITDLATLTYNQELNKLAGIYKLPLAKPSLTLKADRTIYYDDRVDPDCLHLTPAGFALMAAKIVEAYEQNITGKYARIIDYGD